MISTLLVTVDNDCATADFHGDTYDLLKGVATAADMIINKYPKELQQKARVEFIQMLNDAKVGKLYEDK